MMKWQSKDPLSKISIKVKLPLGFIALYLIVFGVGGYFIITSVYAPLNREILLRLKSESLAQATVFDKSLETLSRRAEDFASDGFIRAQTEILINKSARAKMPYADLKSEKAYQALLEHLRVNKLPIVEEFIDLYIYDLNQKKVASARPQTPDIRQFIKGTFRENLLTISSIIPLTEIDDFPSAAITTPLWDIAHEKQIGYLICHFQLTSLIEATTNTYENGPTETPMEKYLTFVDQTGLRLEVPWWYINRARSGIKPGTVDKEIGLRIIPANSPEAPVAHTGKHACENGKVMFSQSYPLRSVDWDIFIEINAGEALAPLRVLEGKLLGIALVVAVTILVLLFFPIQYLIRPLGELQKMAFRIKEGDFSSRTKVNSEDEIGNLAKSFNLMAEAIEERTDSLEQTAADLQRRESELRIGHDRLSAIVHSMTDGVILLNSKGEIVLSNQAAAAIVDRLSIPTNGLHILKCEIDNAVDSKCIACLLDTTRTTSCIITINNTIFEVISTRLPTVKGTSGKILVARDITERERMNERQAHQERLSVLGKTAAVVAHELNSPLAAISMYNQMMESELPEDSPFQEHVDVINRNSQTCQRIIKELLEYARTPQPEIEQVNVTDILANVIRFLKPLNKKISIEHRSLPNSSAILGDRTQLQQVFINLVHNSMQAVPQEGGRIVIKSSYSQNKHKLVIEVEDNGSGIESKYQKEIFEPFFTTKSSGGTGLGLPTAQRIINAHGGELVLAKAVPGKTLFRVTLPTQAKAKINQIERASS